MNGWIGSRRELLGVLGMLPLVPLAGCNRNPMGNSATPLRFWGTGTLDVGTQNWQRAEQDAHVRITFEDNGNDIGPVIARMVSGTAAMDFDIGGVQGGAEPEMFKAGAIIPWKLEQVPRWTTLWEWVKSIPYLTVDGQQIGIPVVVNADSMIYRQGTTGIVDSYASVFDRAFKGRTAMEDSWMNSVIFTAIFMKSANIDGMARIQDPGNLDPDDLGTVIEFLKKQKKDGQFYKFWNGWQEGVDLITSGKVVVMTGWEPIVYRARDLGANDVKYAVPVEGYEGWSNNIVLHKGVQSPEKVRLGTAEAAHRFVNWQLSGFYGCILGSLRGYMVPTPLCIDLLQKGPLSFYDLNKGQSASIQVGDAQTLTQHVREKFEKQRGQIYWQNARPKHYTLYQRLWAELRTL